MPIGQLQSKAATLVAALVVAVTATGFASADKLKMYIENDSRDTLYYVSGSSVETYPKSIPPGEVSPEIGATGANEGSAGRITYANNKDQADASCSVTLEFSWIFDPASGHCDDKNFNFIDNGACSLTQQGSCGGSSRCDCSFAFSKN